MSITAMKLALEALEESLYATTDKSQFLAFEAITSLRQAIAEAEKQEPVAETLERLLWEYINLQAKFPDHKPDPRTWPHVLAYAPQTDQKAVAWSVEGRSDKTLYARSIFHKLEESKNTAAAFAEHYPTVHTIPLYTHPQPKREPLTDEQAERILLDMADHVEKFCKEDTTEKQMSGECIRYILERVAAHGIKE